MKNVNLVSLIDRYSTEDRCRDALEAIRWPGGVACIRCGDARVDAIASRAQWQCRSCDYQFSVTAGTIMHRSHLPLRKWFIAIYLMCESRKGMSANQLRRTLGVQYRTAWHLCHRIREAMGNVTGPTLFGIVEVDETMVGGKARGKGGYKGNKHWVAGAVERGGRVRIERVPDIRAHAGLRQAHRAEAIHRRAPRLHRPRDGHPTARDGRARSRGVGRRRCPHQQRRGRLVPLQALHRGQLPSGQGVHAGQELGV